MESVSTENGYNNRQAHNYYLGYEQALVKRRASPSMAIEASWRSTRLQSTSKVIVDKRQLGKTLSASPPPLSSSLFSLSLSLSFCPALVLVLLFSLQVALGGQDLYCRDNAKSACASLFYSQGLALFFGRVHGRGIIDRLGGAREIRVCRSKEPAEKGGRMWCNTASRRLTPKSRERMSMARCWA